jgi:energy-coupling factor transporter ATP-binding protein EcfA2
VGPFERLDIDLSDGKGNPHLGPHIFAGVNGSGKSTVLRTLAWVMDWQHLLDGHRHSQAAIVVRPPGMDLSFWHAREAPRRRNRPAIRLGCRRWIAGSIVYRPNVKPIRVMAVLRGRRNIKRILRERV